MPIIEPPKVFTKWRKDDTDYHLYFKGSANRIILRYLSEDGVTPISINISDFMDNEELKNRFFNKPVMIIIFNSMTGAFDPNNYGGYQPSLTIMDEKILSNPNSLNFAFSSALEYLQFYTPGGLIYITDMQLETNVPGPNVNNADSVHIDYSPVVYE